MTLTITDVSSCPPVETIENQLPDWSNRRKEEGFHFYLSQWYHLVLVSKAKIVGLGDGK